MTRVVVRPSPPSTAPPPPPSTTPPPPPPLPPPSWAPSIDTKHFSTTNVKNLSISARHAASEPTSEDAVETTKPVDEDNTLERLVNRETKVVEGNPEKRSVDRAERFVEFTESGHRDEIRPEREEKEEARAEGRVEVVEGKLEQVEEAEAAKLETAVVKRRVEAVVKTTSRSRK